MVMRGVNTFDWVVLSAVEWSGVFRALFHLNECKNFPIELWYGMQCVGKSCTVPHCRVRYCAVYYSTVWFLPTLWILTADHSVNAVNTSHNATKWKQSSLSEVQKHAPRVTLLPFAVKHAYVTSNCLFQKSCSSVAVSWPQNFSHPHFAP